MLAQGNTLCRYRPGNESDEEQGARVRDPRGDRCAMNRGAGYHPLTYDSFSLISPMTASTSWRLKASLKRCTTSTTLPRWEFSGRSEFIGPASATGWALRLT